MNNYLLTLIADCYFAAENDECIGMKFVDNVGRVQFF